MSEQPKNGFAAPEDPTLQPLRPPAEPAMVSPRAAPPPTGVTLRPEVEVTRPTATPAPRLEIHGTAVTMPGAGGASPHLTAPTMPGAPGAAGGAAAPPTGVTFRPDVTRPTAAPAAPEAAPPPPRPHRPGSPFSGLEPGQILGRCKIERELGRGGMGAVYLARHLTLDAPVAVKILPPEIAARDPQFAGRFMREAKLACRIRHANIIAVMDAEQDSTTGLYYIVQEFVDGGNVRDLMKKGPVSEARALEITAGVTEALVAAADFQIVHRDIKPDNIMLTRKGVVKLADLGIAKEHSDEDAGLTMSQVMMGTPAYMAPEQARDAKHVDARADIYSLGATLYHVLCNELPYTGDSTIAVLTKLVSEPTPDPRAKRPNLSEITAKLIMRMMAKKAEDRPATAEALLEELNNVRRAIQTVNMGDAPLIASAAPRISITTPTLQEAGPTLQPPRRRRWPAAVAVLALLLLAGGGFLAWQHLAGKKGAGPAEGEPETGVKPPVESPLAPTPPPSLPPTPTIAVVTPLPLPPKDTTPTAVVAVPTPPPIPVTPVVPTPKPPAPATVVIAPPPTPPAPPTLRLETLAAGKPLEGVCFFLNNTPLPSFQTAAPVLVDPAKPWSLTAMAPASGAVSYRAESRRGTVDWTGERRLAIEFTAEPLAHQPNSAGWADFQKRLAGLGMIRNRGFDAVAWTSPKLMIGDPFQIRFYAGARAHALLIYFPQEGQPMVLYPHTGHADTTLEEGQPRTVPDEDDSREVKVSGPPGWEGTVLLAFRRSIPFLDDVKNRPFGTCELSSADLDRLTAQLAGLEPAERAAFSHVYRIQEK